MPAIGGREGGGDDDDDECEGRAADSARVEGESSVAALGCAPGDRTVSGVPSAGGPEKSGVVCEGGVGLGRQSRGKVLVLGDGARRAVNPRAVKSRKVLGGGGTAGAGECCPAGRAPPSRGSRSPAAGRAGLMARSCGAACSPVVTCS